MARTRLNRGGDALDENLAPDLGGNVVAVEERDLVAVEDARLRKAGAARLGGNRVTA